MEDLENNFVYDKEDKNNCWYSGVCDKSKCGDTFCIRHYKMCALTHLALLEGKQRYPVSLYPDSVDLEAYKRLRDIKNKVDEFVKEGNNLLIFSKNTGNGKTEWSKKLLLSYLDKIWASSDFECRALFLSMPKFVYSMKENISKYNEYYNYVNENVVNADLVVWDEVCFRGLTQFEQDYMLNVISQRLAIGKSNIYTTNYSLKEMEEKLGSRLCSRVVGCSESIEFKGSDKRGMTK